MKFKEVTRDLLALGSIPFLVLVLVRILTAGNFQELFHIIIALIIFFIFCLGIKKIDYHIPIIIILAIFTSVFYKNYIYSVFAFLIVISALYLFKKNLKKEKVFLGVAVGLISSILSYLISLPLNIPNF